MEQRGQDVPKPYRPGYELVAEQILAYIKESDFRSGDRLPTEKGIAELFGVTRTVARDAVKVLAAMGRLTVRKGAGIFVAEPAAGLAMDAFAQFQPTDIDQIRMLLDFRIVIETETVRRAAERARPAQVKQIRNAAAAGVAAASLDLIDDFGLADRDFHESIGTAAENDFLLASVRLFRHLAAQTDLLLFHGTAPGSLREAASQHMQLADAIAEGNSDTAVALMVSHIESTRSQFEQGVRERIHLESGSPSR